MSKAEDFVSRLLVDRDGAHLAHWKTKSFAEHKALQEFYEELLDLTDAFVEQYREDRLHDPKILDFIKRIEATAEKEIDDMGPLFRHAARLTVHAKDGRKIYKEVLHRIGSPENPASEEEVYRKFGILTLQCLTDAQRNELIALVRDLDKLDDLGRLTAILAAARAA